MAESTTSSPTGYPMFKKFKPATITMDMTAQSEGSDAPPRTSPSLF
jgi:hypothetical protein